MKRFLSIKDDLLAYPLSMQLKIFFKILLLMDKGPLEQHLGAFWTARGKMKQESNTTQAEILPSMEILGMIQDVYILPFQSCK